MLIYGLAESPGWLMTCCICAAQPAKLSLPSVGCPESAEFRGSLYAVAITTHVVFRKKVLRKLRVRDPQ